MIARGLIVLGLLLNVWQPVQAAVETVPRTILAFYDSRNEAETAWTMSHQLAEMPLNHLGLVVRYHDLRRGLPDLAELDDVRGVLLWFEQSAIPEAESFLRWNLKAAKQGKRIVVMGALGFISDESKKPVDTALIEAFWQQLGLRQTGHWTGNTFDSRFEYQPHGVVGFEQPIEGVMPGYEGMEPLGNDLNVHLRAVLKSNPDLTSAIITTGASGAYVAEGYAIKIEYETELRKWYLDPFKFFRLAYATDDLPKPDTTTLSGRRIYYSHIDGDGWRNYVLIPSYKKRHVYAAQVVLEEVFLKYPDLPTSVGPIAADLSSEWLGDRDAQRVARAIFKLPNIEAASHTYSHPLDWAFFEEPYAGMEDPYMRLFPRSSVRKSKSVLDLFSGEEERAPPPPDSTVYMKLLAKQKLEHKKLNPGYEVPRAFYTGPYSTEKEIQGSLDEVKKYLPPGDRPALLLWSGSTQPYPAAIKATRDAGVRNLNGGDTRFDRKYNSYAWVSPIGRSVGGQQQIYSSNSNENTYTNLWTGPYFGFRNLTQTLDNTDAPIRVKPINVYYHMYSGERLASIRALHEILDHAESQPLTPITSSHFAGIADGFFTAKLERLAENQWRISQRDRLQTLRFDHAAFKAVDLTRSTGVVGQNHLNGSLYVQLDPAVDQPVVTIRPRDRADTEPTADRPYLIDGRWPVRELDIQDQAFSFVVEGFGRERMNWWVPSPGAYRITQIQFNGEEQSWALSAGEDHRLTIALGEAPLRPTRLIVERLPDAG